MVARKRKAKVEDTLDLETDPQISDAVSPSSPIVQLSSPSSPIVQLSSPSCTPHPSPSVTPTEDVMEKMMLKMQQMQDLIERQSDLISNQMNQNDPPDEAGVVEQKEEEGGGVDLAWPTENVEEPPAEKGAGRDVYAVGKSVPSSENNMGSGLSVRGLVLNPTLQQPSVGGLM